MTRVAGVKVVSRDCPRRVDAEGYRALDRTGSIQRRDSAVRSAQKAVNIGCVNEDSSDRSCRIDLLACGEYGARGIEGDDGGVVLRTRGLDSEIIFGTELNRTR